MNIKSMISNIKRNETLQRSFASIFMLLLTIASVLITFHFSGIKQKNQSVDINPKVDVSSLIKEVNSRNTELDKLKNMQSLSIYENGLITPQSLIDACKKETLNQNICNNEIAKLTKKINVTGSISEAKLYIKAGVSRNNSPVGILTPFDSIWFFLDDPVFSGHLIRSKAVYGGITEDGLTELIFDLSNLPITNTIPYDDNSIPKYVDDLKQLNSGNSHLISSFVSTLGYGKIDTLKIYYTGGQITLNAL